MTLQDLKKKPDYYKIDPAWVTNYESVPIIRSAVYGDLIAPTLCKEKRIQSQKDRVALAEAKDAAYKEGFYNGIMLVGDFASTPVQEAKPKIRQQLIDSGDAFIYNEPESLIMSRSGDECVVNLCDQWYLDYGEAEWREVTERCLAKLNTYGDDTRHQFQHTLGWLNQWACARSFGLGTKLPWDPQFLVESLSDSTIYMAYYTVAHLLHGGSLDGQQAGSAGIRADQMTDPVWEYLLGSGDLPSNTDIPTDTLRQMRREFLYFYPMDLRVSGKDLIQNHLTFALYNHTALFPESLWPLGIRANGHLMLNSQKMSKSTGNFLTVTDAIEKFGADATRVALADAGDAIEDANFEDATANAAILRLFTLMEWIEEMLQSNASHRTGSMESFHDRVFANEMTRLIQLTDEAYNNLMFREALKNGFYEFQSARDWYREATAGEGMHHDLVSKFIEAQALMLAPVAPHWSEHVWTTLLKKKTSIMTARWPETPTQEVDTGLLDSADYVRKLLKRVRDSEASTQKRGKGKAAASAPAFDPTKPKALTLIMAANFPEWQEAAISVMKEFFNTTEQQFDDVAIRRVLGERGMLKDKQVMPFVQEIKKRVTTTGPAALDRAISFDEYGTLQQVIKLFERALGYSEINVITAESIAPEDSLRRKADTAVPGEPAIHFWNL
jgi:leucyl-tRNA synthetase